MAETKALAIPEVNSLAEAFHKSGMFQDIKSAAQAVVKIQAGQELGISPVASMTGIHIIQGKVELGAILLAGLVKRTSDYDYKVVEHTDQKCSIEFYHNGKAVYTSTFTIDDAKRAGLVREGSGWLKFPQAMVFARAISKGTRIVCPHIAMGAYVEGEIGGFDPSKESQAVGSVVEGEVVGAPKPAPAAPTEAQAGPAAPEQAYMPMTLEELGRRTLALGFKKGDPRIAEALGGVSLDEWRKLGNTLEDAYQALEQAAGARKATP